MYNVDSNLKPHLSLKLMVNRINVVVGLLEVQNQQQLRFGALDSTIHIDEKPLKIRLCPGNEYPGDDTAQHNSHIPKIMFLAAIGKPHNLPDATEFDGNIGIWPFVGEVEAQRSSQNRARGTTELKGANVTAEDFLKMVTKRGGLLEKKGGEMTGNSFPIVVTH